MLRILIIEDEPAIAGLLQRFLAPLTTYSPMIASNMEEAMKIIDSADPVDIVTLDLGLPDSASKKTVEEGIKEIKAKQPNCLLIVVTGAMRSSFEQEALAHGADGFMEKAENCRSPKTFLNTMQDIIRSIGRTPVRYQKNLPLLEKITQKICEHVACEAQPQTNPNP